MEEMINRKNDLLRKAYYDLNDIGRIGRMCKGIRFETVEAADEFMRTLSSTLLAMSYRRFEVYQESTVCLPEAEEESLDDDLSFVNEEVEA